MATEFVSLLPPNRTAAERALEEASTVPVQTIPLAIKAAKRADDCPVHLLPWLAWEARVDTWNTDWTEEEKRAAIRRAPFIHRHRGTPGAVLRALEDAPFETRIIEWFEQVPHGEPYTFLMQAIQANKPVTQQNMQDMKAAVLRSKNLRSWFVMQMLGERHGEVMLAGWMKATEQTVFGQTVRCYGVAVNGWQTQYFEPVTSFAEATYQVLTHGGSGPLNWAVVTGNASVTQAGQVTVSGPGRVVVSATDPDGHRLLHAIAPRCWVVQDGTAGVLTDAVLLPWLQGYGARLPAPDELKTSGERQRQCGALWNEWGDMQAYGWLAGPVGYPTREMDALSATLIPLTGTQVPRPMRVRRDEGVAYARCGFIDYYRKIP